MTEDLHPGLTGEARRVVGAADTALALGSGDVEVYGTPGLLALIEEACVAAVHNALPEGRTSVGSSVELHHLAPSRPGAEVRAIAHLTAVEGHRLTFEAEAFEAETQIGRATLKRAIVDRSRFNS